MRTTSVAVVGFGAVGRGIKSLFPQAVVYDEPLRVGKREEVNSCEFAFIAVPTPPASDGACDTSIVEDVIGWIESPIIVIRSTISVGTTERLRVSTGKRIVFQPEYGPGATPDHHFQDPRAVNWIILGGDRKDTVPVADLYKGVFNADLVIHQTDSTTATVLPGPTLAARAA